VLGVLVSTFVLFSALGVWRTNASAAALDMLVGVLALVLLARWYERTAPLPSATQAAGVSAPTISVARWTVPLLAYGLVGLTALVYEVSWTRALSMVLGSSIYAFALMLVAFLTGIALGSLAVRNWVVHLSRPVVTYAAGIGALGACALATMLSFR